MSITCFIVDDEYHAIDTLKGYIEQTPGLQLIGTSTNPVAAIPEITGDNAPMLTFLDVDMPELSGIELAGIIKSHTHIIFTTAHKGYAFQAFENDANDYLLKPVSYQRFLKSIVKVKKAIETIQEPAKAEHSDFFYIKTEVKGRMQKVVVKDILYIEGAQNYITLHFASTKLMAYLTMSEVGESLPGDSFSRIHKSFIVNNQHIKTLEHGQLTLDNNVTVPIGRAYKDDFLARMKTLLVNSKRD